MMTQETALQGQRSIREPPISSPRSGAAQLHHDRRPSSWLLPARTPRRPRSPRPAAKEQTRPLSAASPSVAPFSTDEEAAVWWRSSQYLRRRRCVLCCCGCFSATIILVGFLILILAFTALKVNDPTLTMNSLKIDGLNLGSSALTGGQLVSVNATLVADISIKNPNAASFAFGRSATEFYYMGETVGVAYAPEGKVGARKTARMNVTVEVLADKVAIGTNAAGSFLAGGEVNLTSFTDLNGRVNLIGIYKRDVEIWLNCSITLGIAGPLVAGVQAGVTSKSCQADVR